MTTSGAGAVPVIEMAHAVACYQALMETLRRFDDAVAHGPSLLSGWTRAHVVAHLARHADGHRRMLEGVARGEIARQYPGGAEGREAEIKLAATQPADRLLDDLRRTSEALFAIWEALAPELWDEPTESLMAGRRPARELVRARWWELEFHHVDLAMGFGPQQWPRAFVSTALPRIVAGIPIRRSQDLEVPATRWLLVTEDGSGSWLVEESGSAVTVSPADAGHAADASVTGPSWATLVWLMGRLPLDEVPLVVVGDAEVAAALPGRYAYP